MHTTQTHHLVSIIILDCNMTWLHSRPPLDESSSLPPPRLPRACEAKQTSRPATACADLLCYAMLCYAMLCYAMLCYAMLCYAILCYAMLWHAMLRYAMLG